MPWLRFPERQGVDMDDYPHVQAMVRRHRRAARGAARPAVLAERRKPVMDDKAKEMLFASQAIHRSEQHEPERQSGVDHRRRQRHRPRGRDGAGQGRRARGDLRPHRGDQCVGAEAGAGRAARKCCSSKSPTARRWRRPPRTSCAGTDASTSCQQRRHQPAGKRNFAQHVVEGWDEVVAINLYGLFYCCHAVLPAMRAQKDGLIINVSSWAGRYREHAHRRRPTTRPSAP